MIKAHSPLRQQRSFSLPLRGEFLQSSRNLVKYKSEFPIDILARTDDTEKRLRLGDPLIREALNKGKILYERNR